MRERYIKSPSVVDSGSALLPVLIFILLVTILFSTIILYGSYHSNLIMRNTDEIRAYYLGETAMQYALREVAGSERKIPGTLFEESIAGIGRIEYEVHEYGVYLQCKGRGISGKKKVELTGLIGSLPGDDFTRAINLGGADYPLVISGNTRITGDVVVGASGVITGKYKGKGFKGTKLVDGRIIRDRLKKLPEVIKSSLYTYLNSLDNESSDFQKRYDSYFHLSDKTLNEIEKFKRVKFDSGLEVNFQNKFLDLDNARYVIKGNLEIRGESIISGFGTVLVYGDVVIKDNPILKDLVIACKGKVSIEDGALIKCQIISNSEISLTDSSSVEWPGVLVIDVGPESGRIECKSAKASSGTIILLSQDYNGDTWGSESLVPRVIIYPQQTWKGAIYSETYLTESGTVSGNISTNGFYIYSEPTAYINWLVDANISADSTLSSKVIPFIFKAGRRVTYAHYY